MGVFTTAILFLRTETALHRCFFAKAATSLLAECIPRFDPHFNSIVISYLLRMHRSVFSGGYAINSHDQPNCTISLEIVSHIKMDLP